MRRIKTPALLIIFAVLLISVAGCQTSSCGVRTDEDKGPVINAIMSVDEWIKKNLW